MKGGHPWCTCKDSKALLFAGACEAATGVLTRCIVQRWLPREELSVLQHVIVLIGQNCNPVSSAKDHGLQVKLENHYHKG